ncbi:MAG: 2Fe-2S iron-sulfur cluster-binding protein [Acidimicrobiia bacterium]
MPTITFVDQRLTMESRPGEAILSAIVRSGYSHRYGCRRGGCGVCRAVVTVGQVTYPSAVAPTVLTPDEREDGHCLTCRAVPDGDIELRLPDDDELRCVNTLLARILTKERT